MYIQEVENVYDIEWSKGISYGEIHHRDEVEFSKYNFEYSNFEMLIEQFNKFEKECEDSIKNGLTLPAYDYCLKCSHAFNLLDARGVIGVSERANYIGRVRNLAKICAESYLAQREKMGFPLLKNNPWTQI